MRVLLNNTSTQNRPCTSNKQKPQELTLVCAPFKPQTWINTATNLPQAYCRATCHQGDFEGRKGRSLLRPTGHGFPQDCPTHEQPHLEELLL